MTTIAFDGRYLAADGRMTRGGIICSSTVKKTRVIKTVIRGEETEVIIGGAGSWNNIYAVIEWMKNNDVFNTDPDLQRPVFPDTNQEQPGYLDHDVFFITQDGEVYCLDPFCRPAPYGAPFAEGSGFPFAQTALTLGQSAVEAIRTAMKLDTGTGGQITVFDVDEWKWADANDF